MSATHPLDHLVLPVASLDDAQQRYRALGFTVAPIGLHPFGTANCCVYLEDGTFLEPLGVADADAVEKAIVEENAFVGGDRVYRTRAAQEGFSAVVLGTTDAKADAAHFAHSDISGGYILDFSRDVVDKTGKTGAASFRLAFARDLQSPAPFFFTCERVKTPKVNRSALQHHRNRVTNIKGVVLTAPDPRSHIDFLESFYGVVAKPSDGGLTMKLSNAEIQIVTAEYFAVHWGAELNTHDSAEGLRPLAVIFAVPEIEPLASLFNADAIAYLARDNALVVPPATGQGAYFIFEANA